MADVDADLPELLARAKASLAVDASAAAKARIEARLEAVAASLALEWITGERRFESQGQQMEYWLGRLYEALFPDEQPDATRLYVRFGLPLPRAQYVTRLLLARRSAHWREAARNEVVGALETYEANARAAIKADAGSTTPYKISLSRGAYDEVVVIYDRMVGAIAGQDRPSPPRREPSSPTLVWFSITAQGVVALLDQIRKEG
jgi:hypothetical protein